MTVKPRWQDIYECFMMILVLAVVVLLFVEFRVKWLQRQSVVYSLLIQEY